MSDPNNRTWNTLDPNAPRSRAEALAIEWNSLTELINRHLVNTPERQALVAQRAEIARQQEAEEMLRLDAAHQQNSAKLRADTEQKWANETAALERRQAEQAARDAATARVQAAICARSAAAPSRLGIAVGSPAVTDSSMQPMVQSPTGRFSPPFPSQAFPGGQAHGQVTVQEVPTSGHQPGVTVVEGIVE